MALATPRALVSSGWPPFGVPIVDRFATAVPLVSAHHWYKTKASWTGQCLRIATSAVGNPETDVPFDGDLLDRLALAEICGSNDGYVAKVYDPSGNGFDWAQPTHASRPKLWDGPSKDFAQYSPGVLGTSLTPYGAGYPIPLLVFDGVDDFMSIPSALGLINASAMSVAWAAIIPADAAGVYWSLGDAALGAGKYMQGYYNAATSVGIFDGTGYSINTVADQKVMSRYIHTRALNANMNASALYYAGAAAAQVLSNPSVPALEDDVTVVGANAAGAAGFRAMGLAMLPMFFGSDLAANATDLAILNAWMKPAHRCAA